jgi:hypothetical protein
MQQLVQYCFAEIMIEDDREALPLTTRSAPPRCSFCEASCTSQRNQKSELMERARQFTYTLQHTHLYVTGEKKINTWTHTEEEKINTWIQTGEEKVNTWTQRGATTILQ